jgi:hypothetical protein
LDRLRAPTKPTPRNGPEFIGVKPNGDGDPPSVTGSPRGTGEFPYCASGASPRAEFTIHDQIKAAGVDFERMVEQLRNPFRRKGARYGGCWLTAIGDGEHGPMAQD